jgi:hypothetical protein
MTAPKKPAATAAAKTARKAVPVVAPKKAETVTLKTVLEQLAETQDMPKKQALAMSAEMVGWRPGAPERSSLR